MIGPFQKEMILSTKSLIKLSTYLLNIEIINTF